MSILDHVPAGWVLRSEQTKLLLEVEAAWDTSDVLAVIAPTAVGKTLLMYVIAKWTASKNQTANILVPNNLLLDQVLTAFPDLTPLHKIAAYECKDMGISCAEVKETCGNLCKGCVFPKAKRKAKVALIRAMNTYVYFSHRLFADIVMFDEGHQVLDMLTDKQDIKLWQSQYKFPDGLKLVSELIEWMQTSLDKQHDEKLRDALRQIIKTQHGATLTYKPGKRRGKSETVLHVIPTSAKAVPPWLWPVEKVRKVILLSATLSPYDIEEMGLSERRVAYLECESPIKPERRPIIYDPAYNLGYQYVEYALPALVKKIQELLARHPEKGLIHLPYGLAQRVREMTSEPRLLFHDKETKAWALDQFRTADPASGKVLVASGLYEGVDLPYDAARWQLIAKVPFLSLGDQRVAFKAEENPDWYAWEAIKKVIQGAGRIVRAPDDEGVTYLADNNFGRLWDQDKHRKVKLFPQFFRDAFHDRRKKK